MCAGFHFLLGFRDGLDPRHTARTGQQVRKVWCRGYDCLPVHLRRRLTLTRICACLYLCLPNLLPSCLIAFLPTCFPCSLPAYLPTCLAYLPSCTLVGLAACQSPASTHVFKRKFSLSRQLLARLLLAFEGSVSVIC